MDYLDAVTYWHWWIFGIAMAILEVFIPGIVFIWLGIAAGAVGVVVLVLPDLDWRIQFTVFAGLSIVSVAVSRKYLRRHPIATDRPWLNRRGQQYVGRRFRLGEAIVEGRGRLKVSDTVWKVQGPDLPAGNHVTVTAVEGATLVVADAEAAAEAEAKQA
jgi:hypothetical protein